MGYQPNGSEGLNDFADQISTAPTEGGATDAAAITAMALYRVGAQLVDSFDEIAKSIRELAAAVDRLRANK